MRSKPKTNFHDPGKHHLTYRIGGREPTETHAGSAGRLSEETLKTIKDDSGQVMILTALGLVLLLGATGLAVDVGTLYRAKRVAQAAADSGAITAAMELPFGDATTAARADASLNGVTNGSNGATVTVNNPPLAGPNAGNASFVEVIASTSQSLFFLNILNKTSTSVNARAVATLSASQNCIYTLGTSGTDFLINGSGYLTASTCSIIDDSSNSQALLLNGSALVTARSIGIVGNYLQNGSGTLTPTPTTGIAPAADPLAFLSAPAYTAGSCLANPNINGSGTYTLGPSTSGGTVCYNGLTINGGGKTTLNAGTYVINGSMVLNGSGTVLGTGITLYFPSGASYVDNGSETLTISAPTSGTYDGILFYQDRSNTSTLTFNGAGTSTIKGIFYVPTAKVILNGSATSTLYASFVVGSLTFNGSGTLQSYANVNASTPLKLATLAE